MAPVNKPKHKGKALVAGALAGIFGKVKVHSMLLPTERFRKGRNLTRFAFFVATANDVNIFQISRDLLYCESYASTDSDVLCL